MSTILRKAVFILTVLSLIGFVLICRPSKQSAAAPSLKAAFVEFAAPDQITAKIRNPDSRLYRVSVVSGSDRAAAARLGDIVEDLGEFVIISSTGPIAANAKNAREIDQSISLPGGKFDPLTAPPAGTYRSGEPLPEKGYFIIQFGGTVTDEWLDSLRDIGIEVLQYVPNQAFFVYGSGDAVSRAATHSRVRWVGRFMPEQKLSSVLLDQIDAYFGKKILDRGVSGLEAKGGRSTFDIAVFARANADQIAARIRSEFGGGTANVIKLPNNYFNVVRVELPVENAAAVADLDDVIRIDSYAKPVIEDERAAQIVAGNYSSTTVLNAPGYDPLTQFGVDGTGVTVSVADDGISIPGNGGFYLTSANTANANLRGAAAGATGGHGHLNASIIAGNTPFGILDPTNYNYGLGIAPKANILNVAMLVSGYTGSEADAYNDTVTTVGPNGALGTISNNSWGNGTNNNVYDSYTAAFDGYVRDASSAGTIDPITLVFSAGNSGPTALSLTRPKAAKNLIAVGNSENIRTELGSTNADNMDDLRSSSSRGPTSDGRIKPDITAPGSYITGSRAGTCASVTSCFDANHAYSIGTSHAAPQVAGAAALFTQFWRNNNGGVTPSPALIRAAVINTGQEMGGANVTTTVPNGNEGWGRINMKLMFPNGVAVKRINETLPLSNVGQSTTLTGTVGSAAQRTRVTLAWTDPPAVADPALVNNLDLTVTIGANVYKGNVFTGGVSTTGGNADTLNNVENVFLPAGVAAGTPFTIQVTATALNGDGVLGNADTTDQHFGLVAYNFNQTTAVSRVVSDFDGDARSDVSVWRDAQGAWYWLNSSNGNFGAVGFGTTGDMIVPGDYDGDGKTDQAVWRPSNGIWYLLRSTQGFTAAGFGISTDLPAQGDFDGDGKTDLAVFRPSTGVWYLQQSTAGFAAVQFGSTGDKPVPGDYDGDGKTDVAVYRPSNGAWYILRSNLGFYAVGFGISTDKVAPADYDGDGKTDVAVFRDGTWYLLRSTAGFNAFGFGSAGDVPAVGDFDGDGKADTSVFRPSQGAWYRLNSSNGAFAATSFGLSSDKPTEAGYVPIQ